MNTITWSSTHTTWIDIINPTNEELKAYSDKYDLDYHTLADCLEPNHLPKKEKLQNFTFIILRIYDKKVELQYPSTIQEMSNKIAIFYSNDVIITVHRSSTFVVEDIKSKYLETGIIDEPSEIVTKIMGYVLKSYEGTALTLSEKIDEIEKHLFIGKQSKITLEELYYLKNSCRLNKKILNLTRDVIFQYSTTKDDASALEDVKDLLQKLLLSFEETHDDSSNLSNIYLSLVSQKTNEVMKLLTIFSVFFMPLTFIAGIYGMNFDFMPELRWKLGYPLTLLSMLIIGIVIFIWFKRKKII